MDIAARLNMFNVAHETAMNRINDMINSTEDYEQDFVCLIRWLMESETNPYSVLPEDWAGCTNDAISFKSLCSHIHHAMIDDGDIEFITVNDEPRIVFIHRWSENFNNLVLSQQERNYATHGIGGRVVKYDVKVLNCSAKEFIEIRRNYDIDDLRRCFECDAATDLQHAIDYYSKNPLFDHKWIETVETSSWFIFRNKVRNYNGKNSK